MGGDPATTMLGITGVCRGLSALPFHDARLPPSAADGGPRLEIIKAAAVARG